MKLSGGWTWVVYRPHCPCAGWAGSLMGVMRMLVYGTTGGLMMATLGSMEGDVSAVVVKMSFGMSGARMAFDKYGSEVGQFSGKLFALGMIQPMLR